MAQPPKSNSKKLAVDIFSGFCAGINVVFVGHPLETLKVRLQTQPHDKPIYNGFVDCFKKTWQWEGLQGFYKGVTSPLAAQLFFRSVTFMSYGWFLRYWSNNGKKELKIFDYALAGSFSWFWSTLIECPLQLASSQMQVQIIKTKTIPNYVPQFKSVWQFASHTLKTKGITGMYQGFIPQLCRNIPGGAFHFGSFEGIRRKVAEIKGVPVEKVGLVTNLVAGSLGGFFFWTSMYPFDVIKSAIQADSTDPKQRKYHGLVDTFQKLYKEGGAKRFTKGYSACIARALPANAVLLATAAQVKEYGYRYIE